MSTTHIPTVITAAAAAGKLRAIGDELAAMLVERDTVIRGALLALVARQHVLLLGAPGTGKSMLVRAIAERIVDTAKFEVLLTKFSTPEEVFGPLSLSALQEDRYARILDGRLGTAHVGFIDEVGKASSAILNALLAVMNERIIHDDGRAVACPLVSLFGASNEIPDGDELAALYDRFLIKYEVKALSDAGFARLLTPVAVVPGVGPAAAIGSTSSATITLAELQALQVAADDVVIPAGIAQVLGQLRADLREQGVVASDRRWHQALSLLRASAVLDGRDHVTRDDLEFLADVLWHRPEDRPVVARAVAKVGNPTRARVTELADDAVDVHAEAMRQLASTDADAAQRAAMSANSKLKATLHELGHLRDANPGPEAARIEAAIAKVRDLNSEIVRRGFGL